MVTGALTNKTHCQVMAQTFFSLGIVALLASYSLNSQSATATATVTATVTENINVGTVNGMSFGDISASSIAGTVAISTSGSRTITGGVTIDSSVPGSAAAFDIQGETNASYAITLPSSITLSDGVNSMTINNFLSTPSVNGVLSASGQQSLFVGATLNVSSSQALGSYTGTMAVAIEYN